MSNEDVLRAAFDAIGDADVDALASIYAEDYVLVMPYAKPEAVRIEGRDAVLPYLARAFETFRFRLTITSVAELADGDLVAEYTSEGSVVPTGKRYANSYVGIWRFRDGQVVSTKEWYDPMISAEALS